MYVNNWDEFQTAVVNLHSTSPNNVRYVHRFHRSNGELILKATDDKTIVKYKTNQMTDLKKFVSLNGLLMLQLMNKETIDEDTTTEVPVSESTPKGGPEAKTAVKGKKGKKRR